MLLHPITERHITASPVTEIRDQRGIPFDQSIFKLDRKTVGAVSAKERQRSDVFFA